MRAFCAGALGDLLVEAGEASPTEMGGEKTGPDWIVLPTVDFAQIKRDIYADLVLQRNPTADGAQTRAEWDADLHQARVRSWVERFLVDPLVTLFESDQALGVLR